MTRTGRLAGIGMAAGLWAAFAVGCAPKETPMPGAGSLTDIGEKAIEQAERMEEEGRPAAALEAYRRALWAFEYHARLTGREPLLAEDARYNVERLSGAAAP